uniref:CRAL-TRIO domain-containing protein n=1 Tax=Stomoxys calcitrans TaxID=35570 RepID=A0A1I8P613_STOCA
MVSLLPLNAELQKVANNELGEVPSRLADDLEALRQWLRLQPHLKARDDDQFLVQFLRGCKFSLERAKEKIDLYFSLKSQYPEMMNVTNVDDRKFREVHRLGCFQPLPIPLNGNGARIVVFRFDYPVNKYSIDDILQAGIAMHEVLMMHDPYAGIHGLIYIIDYGHATASHYLQLTPNFCKKLVSFLEKSMPLRIKSLYYINTAAAAQQFFKILIPFFSEKMQKRLHVMGHKLDEMLKDLPAQYLPKDYGGDLPSVQELAAEYDKTWDNNREFFRANAYYGTDEKLRPGKPLDIDGLFGVGGSFRKLNVD